MDYHKIRKRPDVFVLVCGLKIHEFDILLKEFESEWEAYFNKFRLDGEARKNSAYEHRNNPLKGTALKLFFILFYLRHKPTQAVMSVTFNMEKYQVNQWIRRLSSILRICLKGFEIIPEQNPDKIIELLGKINDLKIEVDPAKATLRGSSESYIQFQSNNQK